MNQLLLLEHAKFVFVLDGCTPLNKELEVVRRLRKKRCLINDFLSQLDNENQEQLIREKFQDARSKEWYTLVVPHVKQLFMELIFAKREQHPHVIDVLRTLLEADLQVAQCCVDYERQSPRDDVIVIAQDSDYFIFDSVQRYMSIDSLSHSDPPFQTGTLYEKQAIVCGLTQLAKEHFSDSVLREMQPSVC